MLTQPVSRALYGTKQVADAHRGTRRDTTEGGGARTRARTRCMGRQGVRASRGGGVGARARVRPCVGTWFVVPAITVSSLVPNSTIGQYYIHK
eukprot:COSAG02_NODE_3789_length_6229_cov_3.678630_9_plen_93_part_00